MNIKYIKINGYLLPNLIIKENKKYEKINKYGYLRLDYIKKYKKGFYQTLLIKNELAKHLFSVSNECENRLKVLMNNYKNTAEEIIKNEIIYN